MLPLVTIMMPTKNRGHLILDAIYSLINQTYNDWELIILDDCSGDNTEDLVKLISEFDNRIKYFKTDSPFNSIPKSRNKLLKLAKGEFIGHLDDDDFLREDAIESIMNEFIGEPDLALVYSDYIMVDENKNFIREDVGSDFDKDRLPWLGFRHFTIYKKPVAMKFGFNEHIPWCEDGDLFMQIAKNFKCKRVPQFLYYYRSHRINTGHQRPSCFVCPKQNLCNYFRIWKDEYDRVVAPKISA